MKERKSGIYDIDGKCEICKQYAPCNCEIELIDDYFCSLCGSTIEEDCNCWNDNSEDNEYTGD